MFTVITVNKTKIKYLQAGSVYLLPAHYINQFRKK